MIDLHKLDKFRLKDREREFYGCTGDSGNGVFKVYVGGKSFRVIASNGMGWEHVSVSPGSAVTVLLPFEPSSAASYVLPCGTRS